MDGVRAALLAAGGALTGLLRSGAVADSGGGTATRRSSEVSRREGDAGVDALRVL